VFYDYVPLKVCFVLGLVWAVRAKELWLLAALEALVRPQAVGMLVGLPTIRACIRRPCNNNKTNEY
jgi:hypothetical protein